MFFTYRSSKYMRPSQINTRLNFSRLLSCVWVEPEISRIVRIINDHTYPNQPLRPTLQCEIPSAALSTSFVEKILGSLFAAHSNGIKAYEFFKYCLQNDMYIPSSNAFEKTLHILTRMRYFDKAWELIEEIKNTHPSLITLKSISIILSRIAKFQSYEDTLEAFEKMEKNIFHGKKFGTNEFNVLLLAFCTQRQMKEAQSVFNKMHTKYPPNIKTMNILLLGFKESGDVTAVELFYHEMVRRGFTPNNVTYNIRIDAYCKRRHFGDALRLFEEMEHMNCLPTLETITTLIHGAGLARNITKAKQLFDDITERNLQPDTGVYNAFLSSLIRSRDAISAANVMEEMERRGIKHDNVTYHTMFSGLMRSNGFDNVSKLYSKMLEKNFVPKTRTVVMLMKFFCENGNVDLGLDCWNYLLKKGHCPHSHALDLLATGLCSRGRVEEAFDCCKQMLVRGRHVSGLVFEMLKRFFVEKEEFDRLGELENMIKSLKLLLPPPKNIQFSAAPTSLALAFSLLFNTRKISSLIFSLRLNIKALGLSPLLLPRTTVSEVDLLSLRRRLHPRELVATTNTLTLKQESLLPGLSYLRFPNRKWPRLISYDTREEVWKLLYEVIRNQDEIGLHIFASCNLP